MKIKDYECKCGRTEFFFAKKGDQVGIFCKYCGKWFKWANQDEQNLRLKGLRGMPPLSALDIRAAVMRQELYFYVKNGIIYCEADNGDCVKVGEVKGNKVSYRNS